MKKLILTQLIPLVLIACNIEQKEQSEKTEEHLDFVSLEENTIINLYDAFGDENPALQKDFGFSCLIRYKGQTILFDAGSNAEIFKKNTIALGIDLTQVDIAIASHAHFDHINGFDYLLKVNPDVKIYFPYDLFWGSNPSFDISGQDSTAVESLEQKMQYFEGDFESYKFNQTGRFWGANIEFVKESLEIAPGIKLVSTTSPYMGYFSKYPKVGLEDMEDDESNTAKLMGLNEISLSLDSDNGEVVIVGCSHSTVEKIVAETKSYTENNISLVYGGYHLLPYDKETLVDFSNRLKNEFGVAKVAPTHCTGHLAFKTLKDTYKNAYVFAGLGEQIRF
ncbi:MBL fold metallo-hydrolase [Flagellimonas sp. 2504JD4-2]